MDYIEGLAKQASQLTMYDVKSYYNQARNVVLNVSEMEAKVREATNDDPWGASSTLMQQIADATNNFAQFNEVMPTIYSRFMEKEAREWRQIYKALTLLEFLVKSGSERVVDDARAHVSTIKMLRSFHYIDEKGKDQGINVRNRASEIASMLGDVEKIRQERRKAKSNKAKYQGQGNDGGMSFVTSGGSRYGGFGSESVGGGGGGGDYEGDDDFRSSSRGFHDRTESGAEYDEYEGADDFDEQPRRSASRSTSRTAPKPQPPSKAASKVEKPVEKPKEVNLFDFDDDPAPAPAASAPTGPIGGDDEFDDFQQAPSLQPVASPAAKPAPSGNAGLFDLLGSTSTTSVPSQWAQNQNRVPALSSPVRATPTTAAPNFSSMMSPPPLPKPTNPSRPSYSSTTSTPAVYSKPAGASTFDDLWMTSLTSLGTGAKSNGAPEAARAGKKTIKDLEKEKATSTLWGPASSGGGARVGQGQEPAKPSIGGGSGGGGGDDLLL